MSSPEQTVVCVPKETVHATEDVFNNKAQKVLTSSFFSDKLAYIYAYVAPTFCLLVFLKIDVFSYALANVATALVLVLMANVIVGLLRLVGLFFWRSNIIKFVYPPNTPQEKAIRIAI